MKMNNQCLNCNFLWEGKTQPDLSRPMECHRYPPVIQLLPTQLGGVQLATMFPRVNHNMVCGEWSQFEGQCEPVPEPPVEPTSKIQLIKG